MSDVAPGWYSDPTNPMQERLWDGGDWSDKVRPKAPTTLGPPGHVRSSSAQQPLPESKKIVAGILALVLGGFGAHKFYLGYSKAGVLQILLTVLTCGLGSVVALVEGILYLIKSDEEFVAIYQQNKKEWL